MHSRTLQYAFLVGLVLLVTLAFVGIIQDFLLPVFWAAILATVFHPVYQRLRSLLGNRPSVAALLTLVVILVIVILPLSPVSIAVVREATAFSKRLESRDINVQEALQALTQLFTDVTQYLDQFGIDTQRFPQQLAEAALTVSRSLGTQVLQIGQHALNFSVL